MVAAETASGVSAQVLVYLSQIYSSCTSSNGDVDELSKLRHPLFTSRNSCRNGPNELPNATVFLDDERELSRSDQLMLRNSLGISFSEFA